MSRPFEDPRYFRVDRTSQLVADDPDADWRKRAWPRLALVEAVAGGAIVAGSLSLPLGVVTGLEPLPYLLLALTLVGAVVGWLVARRSYRHDPPSLSQIGHVALLHVVVAAAAFLAVEAPYVHWLRSTAKKSASAEWSLLAGMPAEEIRATLGEPDRVEPQDRRERWIYERRYGRLLRHWTVVEIEDGRLVASHLADHRGVRQFVWTPPRRP